MSQSMKRRTIAGLTALAMASLAACGSGAGSSSKSSSDSSPSSTVAGKFPGLTKSANPGKVVYVDAGGASTVAAKAAFLDTFSAQTGITVETLSPTDIAQVRAMVTAGKTIWDVVSIGPVVLSNCGLLFEKIDLSLYENLDKYPAGAVSPCVGAPLNATPIIVSYNTDAFPSNPPTSIKDFFDTKKYPGKRIIYDDPGSSAFYEVALLSAGVKPADLYPLDFAKAEKEMNKIRNDLVIEPTFSAQQADLQNNKWAMSITLQGRSIEAVKNGAKMKPVWETTMVSVGGPAIVKNAPNLANAQLLRAYLSTKEASLAYTKQNGLYPLNPTIKPEEVAALLNDLQKDWNPYIDASKKGTVKVLDANWYAENGNQLISTWTKWKVG